MSFRTFFLLIGLFSIFIEVINAAPQITVYTEKIGNTYEVFVDNPEFCEVSVMPHFKLSNMSSSLKNNSIVIVPSKTNNYKIATLTANGSGEYSYSYDLVYNYGEATLKSYDSDYVYNLPYESGKKYRISQGYLGKKTHQGVNALDFVMPTGSNICAARGGTVIAVEDSNDKHCFNKECDKYSNYLIIQHSDGTFAQYAHLSKKGVLVQKGQKIQKGDLIALSGNTGYTSGPHLHFSVYLPRLETPEYVQTYFKTKKNPFLILKEKKSYKRLN